MQNVAQSWLVWHVSNSPVAIGVIAFFDTLPRLLVGAVGGAIADRFDRRRVLMITQTAAMIQAIIYWLAVEFEVIQLWHIAVLAFFLGIVNTINQTSRQSLVNSLVPKEELLNAIGLQSSVFNFSKILGPSAGGLIIASVGIAGCFLVNAISFVFLLFNLYLMELPPWEKRKDEQNMWADVKEGFHYLLSNRRMLYIVGLSYVIATFGAPYNRFVPIFATNVLHVGASGFGLLMSAPGVGATVSALVFASSHTFFLSFLFLAMIGFFQIAGRALSSTAIQTSTPDHLLGRVLSLFFMDRGLWSLGSMLIGASGAVIGMDWTFAICGAVCAITATTLLIVSRRYRAELARQRVDLSAITQQSDL